MLGFYILLIVTRPLLQSMESQTWTFTLQTQAKWDIQFMTINHTWLNLQRTGYFIPPLSGYYTFSIAGVDDQVLIRLGARVAFSCGDINTGSSEHGSFYSSGKHSAGTGNTQETYHISAGYAMPIKITYCNAD